MDIDYVFSNDKSWSEKASSLGQTVGSLWKSIRDISTFISHLSNEDQEDFIYRLKVSQEKSKGNEMEQDPEAKIPCRVTARLGDHYFYYRIMAGETSYKKKESLFYCEICGLSTTMKYKQIKTHTTTVHPS